MNRVAIVIKNNLSLRPSQADSLNILTNLTGKLSLTKAPIFDNKGVKGGEIFKVTDCDFWRNMNPKDRFQKQRLQNPLKALRNLLKR